LINTINMNSGDWIDAETACALLGVKPQTLYAYVSRGHIRAEADGLDARRSVYARVDIEALVLQNRRPRARAKIAEATIRWGDPVLPTAISEMRNGMLWLRGRSLAECAETLTLEEMAAHLCGVEPCACPKVGVSMSGTSPLGRLLGYLAQESANSAPMQGRAAKEIAGEGRQLLAGVVAALTGFADGGPIHHRIAKAWNVGPPAIDEIRRALVLLADHELNPSTFAVRVCASTGASLPAALLSGTATLSGPRHGGVAPLARHALRAALDDRLDAFLTSPEGKNPYGFGFGHPLYPEGDPRARLILERLPLNGSIHMAVTRFGNRLGLAPNVDCALAALSEAHALPDDAAFAIFAIGRMTGWTAHAIEQASSRNIIRSRARFIAENETTES
jgi:citrate synthase